MTFRRDTTAIPRWRRPRDDMARPVAGTRRAMAGKGRRVCSFAAKPAPAGMRPAMTGKHETPPRFVHAAGAHPVIIAIRNATGTRPSSSRIAASAAGNNDARAATRDRARVAFVSPAARRSRNSRNGSA